MRMQIRFLSESEADYNKVLWRGKGSTCEIYTKKFCLLRFHIDF